MIVKNPNAHAWGSFLSHFHWQFFATATFKEPVSPAFATRAVNDWVESTGEHTYAYVGFENGWGGGRFHCHTLLGGVYAGGRGHANVNAGPMALSRANAGWRHGNVHIERYDSKRGAAWYVSKQPDDGLIIGTLVRHRRRRRQSSAPQPLIQAKA